MTPLDHLSVLGLSPGVSHEEVRKTWRTLVREHHPDKGGDEKRMQQINAAWDTLKNLEDFSIQTLARKAPATHSTQPPQTHPGCRTFDSAQIKKATEDQMLKTIDTVFRKATADWLALAKRADRLSLVLGLRVRKMPATHPLHIQTLETIEVDSQNRLIYKMKTRIMPGKNLFVLPEAVVNANSITFQGHHFVNIFLSEPGTSTLVMTGNDGTQSFVEAGYNEPVAYHPEKPDALYSENDPAVKQVLAMRKRMKGTARRWWRPVAKTLRFLLTPIFR